MSTIPTDQASARHAEAVRRLTDSYAAIEPGTQVRLAKRTSNLFRPRTDGPVTGLDTSGLTGVIGVDPQARTADVQGMCTYEDLVAATLPHGLMPCVVPQLRTITLGGAVTGLGIESTSFRQGLPHESVLEMDVLTGAGEVLTCSPQGPHAELFHAFPNSYGTLGYATRLRIRLIPIGPQVATRNVRFPRVEEAVEAIGRICAENSWEGEPVEFLDGVMFSPEEVYLVLGRSVTATGPTSDYTGQKIYYRSLRERPTDLLSAHDYLWRWDTDWFWCSRAFGA
ncbi:MAG: FAD-binding oxidoreductase, partial [Propionibacteriaceae bacterium]|nr:FAD-binding oxidoreductase [Propionibacteriaceae bacterium]